MSIIRVKKPQPGWELIPNAFVRDIRLSEDAVAVGVWLAGMPDGWEIRPRSIQLHFSERPGKSRAREWWARVSAELRNAGYMRLTRNHGDGGKFSSTWDFSVFGLDDEQSDAALTDTGSASTGSADAGLPHTYIQHQLHPTPKTTTTKAAVVRPDLQRHIDAAMWAAGDKVDNPAGYRIGITQRLVAQGGPDATDLSTTERYEAHLERQRVDAKAKQLPIGRYRLSTTGSIATVSATGPVDLVRPDGVVTIAPRDHFAHHWARGDFELLPLVEAAA